MIHMTGMGPGAPTPPVDPSLPYDEREVQVKLAGMVV